MSITSLPRSVPAVTAVAMSLMGHAIRTGPTSLPEPWLWWWLFAVSSLACVVAAAVPRRWPLAVSGAITATAFVSRAVSIGVRHVTGDQLPVTALLTVPSWMLLAFLGSVVWWHLVAVSR